MKTLNSLCFDQLSSWRVVDVPEDVLALQREGRTVELTFGGPQRGPVTVTAVCYHESFMPWFRVVLRLLGQAEEESDEISVSAPPPAPVSADALTPRQREVANLVADGLTNRDIASQLTIAQSTVREHRRAIAQRLGIQGLKSGVLARELKKLRFGRG